MNVKHNISLIKLKKGNPILSPLLVFFINKLWVKRPRKGVKSTANNQTEVVEIQLGNLGLMSGNEYISAFISIPF